MEGHISVSRGYREFYTEKPWLPALTRERIERVRDARINLSRGQSNCEVAASSL
jgi:hypothetical protein